MDTKKWLSLILIAGLTGCSDDNISPVPVPVIPDPQFTYTFSGGVVKGVIAGAAVALYDADGNAVADATATTDAAGAYNVSFTTNSSLSTPLVLMVDGSGATTICDVQPSCEVGLDGMGSPVIVGFGENYDLPDDFQLRASLANIEDQGSDTFTGEAWVSPLSEFVVSSALAMGDGITLTPANLTVANEQIGVLIADIFPTLEIPAGLEISEVPLLDITDIAGADQSSLTEMSIAMSSVSASFAGFVSATDTERGDISAVISEFSNQIVDANEGEALFAAHDNALLMQESLQGFTSTVDSLSGLVSDSAVTLPDGESIDDLRSIQTGAVDALPEIVDIWTNLTSDEATAPVTTEAFGWADMIFLPDTGEVTVILEVSNLTVTAAHLHEGYAGQNGPVLVGLIQDESNPSRWEFPAGEVLDTATMEALFAGRTYFNVHSMENPAGEIRGQVIPQGIDVVIATPIGLEQVPVPVESDGFAKAAITIDTSSDVAQVHFTSTAIELVAAHIHAGIAGTNGGVVIEMAQDQVSQNHWFVDDVDFSGFQDDLAVGELYFNLHTSANPAGELRGQVVPFGSDVQVSLLSANQVVAEQSVESDASAVAATTLNLATNVFSMHMNTVGITDPSAVHIHSGVEGAIGDILFELTRDDLNGDHWVISDQTFSADQLMLYLNGSTYVDVHTTARPDGELRGQLVDSSIIIDSDGDGVQDSADAFPNDATETTDSDGDGVGDNSDAFINDPNETVDTDGDGVGDNADVFPNNDTETQDSDGDGTGDNADQCPNDPDGTVDSDNDGVCDSSEPPTDSDGDGVPDSSDAFPNDSSETTDSDEDGVGDNADAFPNNAAETLDSDGDGVGDNADAFPNDATETADTDGDGTGDNADAFPTDAADVSDSDADGVGDSGDNCPAVANPNQEDADGDGMGDACEVAIAPAFSEVQIIFNNNCVACHGFSGGLSLSAPGSFDNLVNVASGQIPSLDRVEPGDPDNSYLVWKVEGRSGIVGSRMPLGGVLTDADIETIRAWIAAGANP